ncbi:MAG: creatininase family protein [Opitutaceae bacterium]|jgi:creatinine amidohydrolase|nr:creatininase family protein [Opitutaceae bacterium]
MSRFLGNLNPSAWAALRCPDFAASAQNGDTLPVLPVRDAADNAPLPALPPDIAARALFLPPLRFTPAPGFGRVPDDLFHALLLETGGSVRRSGFQKILLFNTSARARPAVETAALDLRDREGLDALVLHRETAVAAVETPPLPLVVVPLAAVEQHGPHLPTGTDALLNEALLDRALDNLPPGAPVFTAPPVLVGRSSEHFGFDGTLSLTTETLRRLLLSLAGNLRAGGFGKTAFFNTHGGNSAVVRQVVAELAEAGAPVALLRAHRLAERRLVGGISPREAQWGFHAGDWETSLMLAARPGLVRMDAAVREWPAPLERLGGGLSAAWLTRDISRSGVMGDATAATAEKGARWLAEAARALAEEIAALLKTP